MDKWIFSLVGVVLISTILTLLLPDGNLSKSIKFIVGLLIMFVVIQPLLGLTKGDINFSIDNASEQIVFQKDFLDFISEKCVVDLEENCKKILEEKGFKYSEVNIDYIADELGGVNINFATIDLKNAVYNHDSRHIDIIEDIILPVSKYLDIEEKQVSVIE